MKIEGCKHTQILHEAVEYVVYAKIGQDMHISKPVSTVTTYLKRSLQKVHIYIKNSGCKHTKILHGDIEYVDYAKIGQDMHISKQDSTITAYSNKSLQKVHI